MKYPANEEAIPAILGAIANDSDPLVRQKCIWSLFGMHDRDKYLSLEPRPSPRTAAVPESLLFPWFLKPSMRTSVAAFALFRRAAPAGRVEYLAQWNEGWNAFHFIGGHKRDNESLSDCCVREASEELGLVEGREFRVATERRRQLRYIHWSERAQTDTTYTIELFDAELLPLAGASIEADANNRWLTESDIRAGRCCDGRAVSATMLRILSLAGLMRDELKSTFPLPPEPLS